MEKDFEFEKERLSKNNEINLLSVSSENQKLKIEKSNRNIIFLLLSLLGAILGGYYVNDKRKKVSVLNTQLEGNNLVIAKSLEEKEFLIKEIHHRVKNNLQVISSLLNLQLRQSDDKKTQDILKEGKDRVRSMSLIHQHLYQENQLGGINMKAYIDELAQELYDTYVTDQHDVKIDTRIEDISIDVDTVVPIGLILNELITNSLKYAFPDKRKGHIHIKMYEDEDQLYFEVSDDGIGYDPDETKRHQGLGMRLIKSFARRLNATVEIRSTEGVAHKYKIPKAQLPGAQQPTIRKDIRNDG